MTVETFFANFGHLADAPNGVRKLRELILQFAVQGHMAYPIIPHRAINSNLSEFSIHAALIMSLLLSQGRNLDAP